MLPQQLLARLIGWSKREPQCVINDLPKRNQLLNPQLDGAGGALRKRNQHRL